jgi:hypothetical protein
MLSAALPISTLAHTQSLSEDATIGENEIYIRLSRQATYAQAPALHSEI